MTSRARRTARGAMIAFAILAGLQGCATAGAGSRRSWSYDDDRRPVWLPPAQERYPGHRLPDDGFRDTLARLGPGRAGAVSPA